MKKGFIKLLMLHIISRNKVTGYDLMKHIEYRMGYRPSSGAIYPILKSMESEGLIKGERKNGKIYYSITEEGLRRLDEIRKLRKEYIKKIGDVISIANEVFEDICPDDNIGMMYFIAPIIGEIHRLMQMGVDAEKIQEVIARTVDELRALEKELED